MLPLCKMASWKNNPVVSCQLGSQNVRDILPCWALPITLPITPVLSFKPVQISFCCQACSYYLQPSCANHPAYLPSQKALLLCCLKAKAVAQGDLDETLCIPVALGCVRHGMG